MDQTIKDKDLLRRHVKVQVLRSHPIECTEYMHATAGGLAFLLPDTLVALLVCYLVLLCTSPCLDWSITSSDPGVLYGARFVHLLVGDDRSIDARRAWWPAATITGGLPPRARATTARDLRGRQVSRISRSRAGRQVDGSDGWSVISLILSPAVPRAGTSYVDEKRDTYVMVRYCGWMNLLAERWPPVLLWPCTLGRLHVRSRGSESWYTQYTHITALFFPVWQFHRKVRDMNYGISWVFGFLIT